MSTEEGLAEIDRATEEALAELGAFAADSAWQWWGAFCGRGKPDAGDRERQFLKAWSAEVPFIPEPGSAI